jgi:hypothetical protein
MMPLLQVRVFCCRFGSYFCVFIGGGAIEMELSRYLRDVARSIAGKEQLLIAAFARAFEVRCLYLFIYFVFFHFRSFHNNCAIMLVWMQQIFLIVYVIVTPKVNYGVVLIYSRRHWPIIWKRAYGSRWLLSGFVLFYLCAHICYLFIIECNNGGSRGSMFDIVRWSDG